MSPEILIVSAIEASAAVHVCSEDGPIPGRANPGRPLWAADLSRSKAPPPADPGSSGALGNATNGVVEKIVPLISAAPVPRRVRERWLERLFDAIQEDDAPYIEPLGEHRGVLCADQALASHWADQLPPLVPHVLADRRGVFQPIVDAVSG